MKNLIKISLMLSAFVLFFVFSGCGEDELKPENFKTQQEAEDALVGSDFLILFALNKINEAESIATDFDGTYPSDFLFKNRSSSLNKKHTLHTSAFEKKLVPNTFGYNSQTGFWGFDTTVSDTQFTGSAHAKIRFTPHDLVTGLPTENTNSMEYDFLISANGTDEGGAIGFLYDTKLDVIGITGFKDTTGNATINGSNDLAWEIDFTDETGAFLYDFEFDNVINNVTVSLASPYPQGGTIEFNSKGEFNVDNFSEKYYIRGKITFNGTNIALLEFGGFEFHINLDGPYIVELVPE